MYCGGGAGGGEGGKDVCTVGEEQEVVRVGGPYVLWGRSRRW